MRQRNVLAVHDVSCVGRCSLTVALPIVSSAGVECSVLPTAVLSTHTGGFTGFTFRDLTEDIAPISDHWRSLGLRFDALYTGFLGSFEQIGLVKALADAFPDARVYVDPVMGDKGKLYSIFGEDFPMGMKGLCEKADLIMPNLTELAFMLGFPYEDGPYGREYIGRVLDSAESLGAKRIVITGVSFEKGRLGAVFKDYRTGDYGEAMRDEIPGYYHGTGDVFGSALVGALESGLGLADAVSVAVDLTVGSIARTRAAGSDVRFGVNFETGLHQYASAVRSAAPVRAASSDEDIASLAALAEEIWPEAYGGVIPDGQAEYMVSRFQTPAAFRSQLADGFQYDIARKDGRDVGYCGYRIRDGSMFVSKLYVLKGYRDTGVGREMLETAFEAGRAAGAKDMALHVNRNNSKAIAFYRRMGLHTKAAVHKEIGDGFFMDDYIMGRSL